MRARAAVIITLATVAIAESARPCDMVCVSTPLASGRALRKQMRESLEASSIVFLGRVVEVVADEADSDRPPELADRVATLEVLREWKGPGRSTYLMKSGCCGASCGYEVKPGEMHILFLTSEPGWFDFCWPRLTNAELRRMAEALDSIRGGKHPPLPKELR